MRSVLHVLILALLSIRLMVPPGVCLCHLAGEAHEQHEGHHDGCPASGLGPALGLQPASPDLAPPSAALDSLPEPRALVSGEHRPVSRLEYSASPPAYLSGCALLI